ncbi:unnamed protein product [Brassica oleracea var. botrytis]
MQVCSKGMLPLQYRDFSSVSEKAVSKIYGYFFKTVFGGAGILLARVTTSPFSSGLQEIEDDVFFFFFLIFPI